MFLFNFFLLIRSLGVQGFNFVPEPSENSSNPSTIISDLLTECDDLNPHFAVLIGSSNIEKWFFNVNSTSLVLMNEEIIWTTIPDHQRILLIQPKLFIINARTDKILNQSIEHLKLTAWWDIRSFYIIYKPTDNCHDAFNYLWMMWKKDLINAVFICHEFNKKNLFTFNPFTNRAPSGWKIIPSLAPPPWTFFHLTYNANSSICSSLMFDKTQILDGYSGIHGAAFLSPGMVSLNSDDDQITKMLFTTLNLTRNFTVDLERGYVDGGEKAFGMVKNLTQGDYDIILNSRYIAYAKGIQMSSIIAQSGLAIVSQPRGYISIVRKIIDYFPIWFFLSIIFTSIITAFVLKYSLNSSFGSTFTEVFGFVLDGEFLTLPSSISSRIFLFGIFMFVMIIQTLFRGRILAFLTIPIPERNMDTFEDLIEAKNYKIFCDLGMRKFVHSDLKDRCINISAPTGMKALLTDAEACFLSDQYILIRFMKSLDAYWLHLSRHVIREYGIFMMRENLPLADRINQGVSRMFESHLSTLVYLNVYERDRRKIRLFANRHLVRRFRAIRLNDLIFAFEMWIICIIISISVFIVEVKWKPKANKQKKKS